MVAAATDYFVEVGNPGTATTLAAPGHSIAGTTFNVVSTSNWPTTTGVIFAVDNYTLQTVNGVPNTPVRTPGTYTEWEGVVASGTQITGAVLRYGTDQNYAAGSLTRVYIPVASSKENRLSQGIRIQHNQDGTHGAVTATSVVASGNITAANFIQTGGAGAAGWTVGLATPNTVTANGNRSYDLVFNATDLTTTVSNGMRLRTTRTVTAPTQCTSLNGTTQYYSKTTPAGMTFTDDFVVSAWVKLTSYAQGAIASRYNGTDGWILQLNSSGQVQLLGFSGGAANFKGTTSYQSISLNKWVHVTAQIDMNTATATTTTNYVMIDGVDCPTQISQGGTNPTSLVQGAGALNIGGSNSVNFFPGKIAQVAIYNAKVTQANIRATISQTLSGSETSLISAYSFNNSINDLNANANNLTANGSAVATNADSPFSLQADGTTAGTTDYAIITKTAFSTNTTLTVQVPEGNTIPTTGGVSAVAYSSNKAPYGMPVQSGKWSIESIIRVLGTGQVAVAGTWYNHNSSSIAVPIGQWNLGYQASLTQTNSSSGAAQDYLTLSTGTSSETNTEYTSYSSAVATTDHSSTLTKSRSVEATVQTPYYLNIKTATGAGTITLYIRGDVGASIIRAENAYL